jgi:hypothetical protein
MSTLGPARKSLKFSSPAKLRRKSILLKAEGGSMTEILNEMDADDEFNAILDLCGKGGN